MVWEYLDSEIFMIRCKLARDLICSLHKPNFILDINCGKSSNLKEYIPDYCNYYGNDKEAIEYEFRLRGRKTIVEQVEDTNVLERIEKWGINPDVIVYMGDGIGDINPNGFESENGRQVAIEAVKKYQPKVIVHEAVQKYENEYGILSMFAMEMKSLGYHKRFDMSLDIGEDKGYFINFRRMCVYSK